MNFEIHNHGEKLIAWCGPNFSGRSKDLRRWADENNGLLLTGSTTSAISGLRDTVANELRFYCKNDAARFSATKSIAEEFGLQEIWHQNPFAGECSGGQEAILAILCRLSLERSTLGVDTCIEQLSLDLRRHLYQSVLPRFSATRVGLIDNRLDEVWSTYDLGAVGRTPDLAPLAPVSGPAGTLSIDRITFEYRRGKPVLKDFCAEFAPGIHHLYGRNGAGKSTAAKIIAGLLRASSGRLEIGGRQIDPYREPGKLASFAFQDPNLQLFALKVPEPKEGSLFDAFGLRESVGQHPLDLPWVLRKRLSVAQALERPTRVVILDEPTLGQDKSFCQSLATILRAYAGLGRIIVVISHSTTFVRMLNASRIDLDTSGAK